MDGIELSEGRCLAFFKNIRIKYLQVMAPMVQETSYRNLLNLKEVFLSNTTITLIYDWLSELLWSLQEEKLKFRVVEVATIYREVCTPPIFLTILGLINCFIA
jgi:hypothetical protein